MKKFFGLCVDEVAALPPPKPRKIAVFNAPGTTGSAPPFWVENDYFTPKKRAKLAIKKIRGRFDLAIEQQLDEYSISKEKSYDKQRNDGENDEHIGEP